MTTPVPRDARERLRFCATMLAIAAAAVLIAFGISAAPTAAAETHTTEATITDVQFTQSSVTPKLSVPASATLTLDYTLPDNAAPGAGFRIALDTTQGPPTSEWADATGADWGIQFVGTTFPLLDGDGDAMGSCTVQAGIVDCDIDDSYLVSHPLNVTGSVSLEMRITGVVTPDDGPQYTTYTLTSNNGTYTPQIVLDPVGWCDPATDPGACNHTEVPLQKFGFYQGGAEAGVHWQVNVPSPQGGATEGDRIVVTDRPGEGYTLQPAFPGGDPVVPYVVACDVASGSGFDWEGGVTMCTDYQRVTSGYTISDDLTTVTIEARAGFLYRVSWWSTLDGVPQNGDLLANDADVTINGADAGSTEGQVRDQEGSGTIIGENEGRFSVIKTVTGASVPGTQSFDVDWVVASPSGTPIASGVASVSAEDDPTTTSVQENRWNSPAAYPVGSIVTLSERTPSGPAGVTWEAPVFAQNDVAIQGGSNLLVGSRTKHDS